MDKVGVPSPAQIRTWELKRVWIARADLVLQLVGWSCWSPQQTAPLGSRSCFALSLFGPSDFFEGIKSITCYGIVQYRISTAFSLGNPIPAKPRDTYGNMSPSVLATEIVDCMISMKHLRSTA